MPTALLSLQLISKNVTIKNWLCLTTLSVLILTSCDPGVAVVISNRSARDQKIQVFYKDPFALIFDPRDSTPDSLSAYRLSANKKEMNSRDYYKYPIRCPILSLDTIARSYYFVARAGYKIIVESKWLASTPVFGQKFIIDGGDTLELIRHGHDFRKRPKFGLGGDWEHTIDDNMK